MLNFNLGNVTIGADPEIFVGRRDEIISAHHLPFGTKAKPRETTHGSVQVDGMALEVNVKPSATRFEFIKNCAMVINDLERLLKAEDREMYLVVQPVATFEKAYIDSLPDVAKELGCNPDWNAYDLKENERPNADGNFRTSGGHIHIGWGSGYCCTSLEHIADCAEVAKQLDYTVGLASLDFDTDAQRRSLYGQAGAFRPKPYGMEYRVMSPMWLLNPQHTAMVYTGAMKALRLLNEGSVLDEQFEGLARDFINKNERGWRSICPELEKAVA